uniref:Uncharacterized protein n=1 Tax=Brassica oleracea var. oleracea TaxID=109376 RepID=A0A0D3B8S6_BRAOL
MRYYQVAKYVITLLLRYYRNIVPLTIKRYGFLFSNLTNNLAPKITDDILYKSSHLFFETHL